MEGGTGLRNTGFMNWPERRLSEYSVHLVQRNSKVIKAAGVDINQGGLDVGVAQEPHKHERAHPPPYRLAREGRAQDTRRGREHS